MKTREKVSSSNILHRGECTNVVELETSFKELQVSDPVLLAFGVLPVEQAHEETSSHAAARRGHDSTRWAIAEQ